MKTIGLFLSVALVLIFSGTAGTSGGGDGPREKRCIKVCHVPRGNPAAAETICIGPRAAAAHINHHAADSFGPCDRCEFPALPEREHDCALACQAACDQNDDFDLGACLDDCRVRTTCEDGCEAAFEACGAGGGDPSVCERERSFCRASCLCDEECCHVAFGLCSASEPADPLLCSASRNACLRGASCLSCGDGIVDEATEECDDGNADADDGCFACKVEACPDGDGDGVCDADDVCPNGDDNVDTDVDGTPDACDPCPFPGACPACQYGACSATVCGGMSGTRIPTNQPCTGAPFLVCSSPACPACTYGVCSTTVCGTSGTRSANNTPCTGATTILCNTPACPGCVYGACSATACGTSGTQSAINQPCTGEASQACDAQPCP